MAQLSDYVSVNATEFWYSFEPISLLGGVLYAVNRWWLKPHIFPRNAFIHGHLNDLLAFPVALPALLLCFRLAGLRDHDQPPTLSESFGWLAFWSLLFEFVFPRYFHLGVSDPLDVAAYAAGLVLLLVGISVRSVLMTASDQNLH